jgi:hypothetical protein
VNKREHLVHKVPDVHRRLFTATASEHHPDACNDVTGTMTVIDYSPEDSTHLIEISIRLCKQPQADHPVCDERRQRLINFVGNRGDHRIQA